MNEGTVQRKTAHQKFVERVEQQRRVLNEAADRLVDVIEEFGGTVMLGERDRLLEQTAYVLGLEGDYDPEDYA